MLRSAYRSASTAGLKFVFKRYMRWRLDEISDEPGFRKIIALDYRFEPRPRWGYLKPPHPEMQAVLERGRPAYRHWLAHINEFRESLLTIASESSAAPEPTFENSWFLGLDAAALYAVLATERPKNYVEVGSGNSTMFARRAIRDHRLPTRIVSIDPQPRADVESLCDRSLRQRMEDVDRSVFAELAGGDVLFIDNSHRSFQNSDATVFFLEVLPLLRPGVIVQIHDIFWPLDYPPSWGERYYSEQYLLGCWLLANPKRFDLMLSNAFVSIDPELSKETEPLWEDPRFAAAKAQAGKTMDTFKGFSFWCRMRGGDG